MNLESVCPGNISCKSLVLTQPFFKVSILFSLFSVILPEKVFVSWIWKIVEFFYSLFQNLLVCFFSLSHSLRLINSCKNGLSQWKPSHYQILLFWLHHTTKNVAFSPSFYGDHPPAPGSHHVPSMTSIPRIKPLINYRLTTYWFSSLLHCSLSGFSCFLLPIKSWLLQFTQLCLSVPSIHL